MNIALAARRPTRRRRYRWRRVIFETASVTLGIALVIWSLMPVYNMMLIALDPEGENEFDGKLWPPEPSLDSFRVVWTQGHWYLENIWHQFGNSLYIGLLTMLLTLLISSLASFAVGRMRLEQSLAAHRHRSSHLRCSRIPSRNPILPPCAGLRTFGQSLGRHRRASDVRHTVCCLDLATVCEVGTN